VDPIEVNVMGLSRVEEKARRAKKGKAKEIQVMEEDVVRDEK
jgi:hypothetical protein